MPENDAHIQDADILKMSKQETNDAGNRIRFLATLPSGREIHSEWLDPSQRREAMHKWLEAVRAQIVQDEEEARLRAKRGRIDESQSSVPPAERASSAPIRPAVSSNTAAGPSSPSVQSVLTDPTQFIRQALEHATHSVAYWRTEAAKATANWQAAEADLKKWRAIALSIGVSTGEETSPARAIDSHNGQPWSESVSVQQPGDAGIAGGSTDSGAVCEV